MPKPIIAFVLASAVLVPALAVAQPAPARLTGADIEANAPTSYTVQRGDTLWGIASRFLKDPWKWPDLWQANREAIGNPHLIYPGDVIRLDQTTGTPALQLVRAEPRPEDNVVRLSPRTRVEPLAVAVPTIPGKAIGPFLSQPLIVEADGLDNLPRIVGTEEDRVIVGAGTSAYVAGLPRDGATAWQIFRPGNALRDPDTGAVLGYEAVHVGDARVRQFGAPSTVDVIRAKVEINVDDRLRPAPDATLPTFLPRAPGRPVRGSIVSVQGGVADFAQYAIVAINRGARDGIEPGHVLASVRKGHALGRARSGRPTLAADLLGIRDEDIVAIPPIPETIFPWAAKAEDRQTPDERNGIVMVFKTFDRISYAMVMKSTRPITVGDIVTTP